MTPGGIETLKHHATGRAQIKRDEEAMLNQVSFNFWKAGYSPPTVRLAKL
jgi:hypothetical protein